MTTKTHQAGDIRATAQFFAIFWAVLVLAPRANQTLRATFKMLGLVKPQGALALSARGRRMLALAKEQSP